MYGLLGPVPGLSCFSWKHGFLLGVIVIYMLVSMSLTLLDKWIITGLGFRAPITLILLTYLIMHIHSIIVRHVCADRDVMVDEQPIVQQLTVRRVLTKVVPVAAASGLEVGTSMLGLQVMQVGFHTMVRATVPIFVLLFSVCMGLQTMRPGLLGVVLLVSGGVAMLSSGEADDGQFQVLGFVFTLLSGLFAGLKWALSQVLLQGRGNWEVEQISPFTLLHYMSISSAAVLVPFAVLFEGHTLRSIYMTSEAGRVVKIIVWIWACSSLAMVLVFTEFLFIRHVSSLGLSIISVTKELILVMFTVLLLGDSMSLRTATGFFITLIGVCMYRIVSRSADQDVTSADNTEVVSSTTEDSEPDEAPTVTNNHEDRVSKGRGGKLGRYVPINASDPVDAADIYVDAVEGGACDPATRATYKCFDVGHDGTHGLRRGEGREPQERVDSKNVFLV